LNAPGSNHGSGFFFSEVAVLIDGALLRTSELCKKLKKIVDRTHPALVRAVLQKKLGTT